jgi:hypothetical protein
MIDGEVIGFPTLAARVVLDIRFGIPVGLKDKVAKTLAGAAEPRAKRALIMKPTFHPIGSWKLRGGLGDAAPRT